MHVLFVHKNFPAQFGHIAAHLVQHHGWRCTFVSERPPGKTAGVERIQYRLRGGATQHSHYCSRSFENFTWHSHGVYEAMKARPDIRPDLIVGHSGFGSTLFLSDLYDCPIINYFEWYYHNRGSDGDFRREFPKQELDTLRAKTRNAMILADLENCAAGYSPTHWQRSQFPAVYQRKLRTLFDGIDTDLWRPPQQRQRGPRRIGDREIPADTRIVTYVARGFELVRGFDIFMKVAQRIAERCPNVLFVCIGSDRICYGGEQTKLGGKSFREHVLSQDDFDLDRFWFMGTVPPDQLAGILQQSDLHIYLTIPFVLSWSLMDALACGCTVLASDTEPVREMITHGDNGLLSPFYDVEGFARQAIEVLKDPEAYRPLGTAAAEMIERRYSMRVMLPQMLGLYQSVKDAQASSLDRAAMATSAITTLEPPARPDLFAKLLRENPWPTEPPAVKPGSCCDTARPAHDALMAAAIQPKTALVVELGAWSGAVTGRLLEKAPNARLIAIDQWKSPANDGVLDWKTKVPSAWQRFVLRCWQYRDRIVAWPVAAADGLRSLYGSGERPDAIYVHGEHSPTWEDDLRIARALFPKAVLLGDHWQWPRVQHAISQIVEGAFVDLEVAGDMWRLGGNVPRGKLDP